MCDRLHAAISSGVPVATTSPPAWPPSGPRSITWSAVLITSRWCSITSTVCPASTSRFSDSSSRSTSARCRPVVGSSRMYRVCLARWSLLSSVGDLDPLGLAAGERRRRLAERQVAQAQVVEHLDLACRPPARSAKNVTPSSTDMLSTSVDGLAAVA